MKIGLTLCIIASVCMAIMVQASSNAAQLQSMRTRYSWRSVAAITAAAVTCWPIHRCVCVSIKINSVYAAIVARSGEKSDCGTFVAMFSPDGVIRSPVGATPAVGKHPLLSPFLLFAYFDYLPQSIYRHSRYHSSL